LVIRRSRCCGWRWLRFGLFAARTAHRSAKESRLFLLGHRRWRRLRRRRRAFGGCYRLLWGLLIDRWLKTARGGIAIGTVRTLVAVAAAKSTVALLALAFAIAVMRSPVVTEAMFAATRSVAIVTVTAKILAAAIASVVVAVKALAVTAVVAVVVEASALIVARLAIIAVLVIAILIIEIALRLLIRLLRWLAGIARLLQLDAELVALVVAELVTVVPVRACEIVRLGGAIAQRVHTALSHLFAVTQDDAIIVLGMLQIILRKHRIARGQRIPRQCDIFLGDVRGRAADFYVRSGTLKAAHQGVLRFAVVVIPTATATVLLSLPHGLPFTLVNI
jgi:hypothetical protein